MSAEVPGVPHYWTVQVTAFVSAIRGPLTREVGEDEQFASETYNIHLWEWVP